VDGLVADLLAEGVTDLVQLGVALRAPTPTPTIGITADRGEATSGRRELVTRQHHAAVHALLQRDMSLHAISKELQL
jgi:hypothetical protein